MRATPPHHCVLHRRRRGSCAPLLLITVFCIVAGAGHARHSSSSLCSASSPARVMGLDHANWATETEGWGCFLLRFAALAFGTGFRPTLIRHCLALRGRAQRRGRRRPRGSAGATRTHAGATGAHAGTARTHTRGRRSTRENEQPLSSSWRQATRATGGTRGEHAMVVIAIRLVMPGDCSAGEEDNRHDENNAGNDHHPRRSLVESGRLCRRRRRRGVRGDRLDRGFGWFSHLLIMHGTRDSHQTFRP
jgi:hypothetical protein